jgi:hypothetical protein
LHLDENIHTDNQHHHHDHHTKTLLENRFSDSIESLKSLSSEANSSFSSSLKMNNKHGNINLTGSSNKSLSRKSLTKLNNTCQENENLAPYNQQLHLQHHLQQQQMSSSSSIINRKSNNSWIAQSFRKAFGKIENRRKNNQLNKSQVQLNKSLKAMSSTFSVNTNMNDYEYLSTGGSSQRNSSSSAKTNQISTSSNCSESGGSKRSSLSDDENVMPKSAYHYNARKQFLSNKLSLAPMSIHVTNNVETDLEDQQQNLMDMNENHKYQKNALFAVAKRSYRSESELAKSVKHNVNNENQIKDNNCKNSNNYKADRNTYEPRATDRFSNDLPVNLTTTTPTNTNNLNSKNPNSCTKLNKSVSSLLSGPNQNFEYNTQRIEEINQSHITNTNRVAIQQQQQQIQRSKTPINNKILNSSNQILSNNPNLKW